jgi:hypothetical protein
MSMQRVDLYQPMMNDKVGPAPVALRIGITPNAMMTEAGPQQGITKPETYVLLSALPTELQERVRTAIQTLLAGR